MAALISVSRVRRRSFTLPLVGARWIRYVAVGTVASAGDAPEANVTDRSSVGFSVNVNGAARATVSSTAMTSGPFAR